MNTSRLLKNLDEEKKVLSNLKSVNIIKTYATYKTERHFYMVNEYCNGGDLDSLITAGLVLQERHIAFIYGSIL